MKNNLNKNGMTCFTHIAIPTSLYRPHLITCIFYTGGLYINNMLVCRSMDNRALSMVEVCSGYVGADDDDVGNF